MTGRILRVAELLHADVAQVRVATADLPRHTAAAVAELAAGTLLTLELRRPWWDRRPRQRALKRLHAALAAVESQTHRVLIVAAAIIRNGQVLAAQRNHPAEMAGKWEFPGGKVERGETPVAALVRECAEELGTQVTVGPEVAREDLDSGTVLILFQASLAADAGEPRAIEHRDLGWFGLADLGTLDWLPTNRRFVTDVTRRL